jgi:hypothetical protein
LEGLGGDKSLGGGEEKSKRGLDKKAPPP